ncbi:MAG TPA: peptide deformylase [Pirellulaceae bacterium]|jgi:peptide deformylase|nr:peptide deformylase [Pirellulaceae bacterium]
MLKIVHYPHPILKRPSKPLRRVDDDLRAMVREMFDLMYKAKGIGLAANQVDLPLRLFVVNTEGNPEKGQELVFINPVISRPRGTAEAEEGCLSIPSVYGLVKRPKEVDVQAYDLQGNEITASLSGMMARVVQHELDHLDGTLFVERMSEAGKMTVDPELDEFRWEFQNLRSTGGIPADAELAAKWEEWEAKYC